MERNAWDDIRVTKAKKKKLMYFEQKEKERTMMTHNKSVYIKTVKCSILC